MKALEVLLHGLFDYAGTYPPAAKPLQDALKESAEFSKTLHRPYLVGAHLVLPLTTLESLDAEQLASLGFRDELRLAILCESAPGKTKDFWSSVARDAERVAGLAQQTKPIRFKPISYELKVPLEVFSRENEFLATMRDITQSFFETLMVCVEPVLSESLSEEALSRLTRTFRLLYDDGIRVALKLRTGDTKLLSRKELAKLLHSIGPARIPLKVTGGMHHPIIEAERWSNEHAFLPTAVALYLLRHSPAEPMHRNDIHSLLSITSPDQLSFANGIQWGKHFLPLETLEMLRRASHFSIGSCSLDEPDADLRRLFPIP